MKDKTSGVYIWGALLGMVVGIISAHLYQRAIQEHGDGDGGSLSVQDTIALAMLLFGVVRQIAEAGANAGKSKKKED